MEGLIGLPQPSKTKRNADHWEGSSCKFWKTVTSQRSRCIRVLVVAISVICATVILFAENPPYHIPYMHTFSSSESRLSPHCANVSPIQEVSFHARQRSLAQELFRADAAAYIAEPGPSAAYFANISNSHWRLSERPLLLMILPALGEHGEVQANISVLSPKFETTRAKLLPIPGQSPPKFFEWAEDADPYAVAISTIHNLSSKPIYVDDSVRLFIAEGLQKASSGNVVASAPVAIKLLRERKSSEEIDILKCANEATLLAIREAREKMYIGIRESEAGKLIRDAITSTGLEDAYALTLFGENAALPHGGGTDRILGAEDLVLIDCGGTLHGYRSDLTRTFALTGSIVSPQQLKIWNIVHEAQSIALNAASNGTITASVDRAAREVIEIYGYGKYFTHRLGHGIGLETHESPYLRGGSNDIILPGHTFSNEPGIYIEGEIGIRLEDCFYIDENGQGQYLTAGVGGQANNPWDP